MDALIRKVREFRRQRGWDRFHSPKNLAMALTVEAAELAENFQWMSQEQSRRLGGEKHAAVAREIGDVLIYLVNLADKLGIDPLGAAHAKLAENHAKYPADKVFGKALKYSEYT